MNRRVLFVVAIAIALACGLFAAPRRYVVDGVSMGPGLLPGDVVATGWLPGFDRWRPPGRFDRWIVTLPDGSTGLKRVVGLPGEMIALVDGDLVVDGRPVLKGPRQVAEMGSVVAEANAVGTTWSAPPALVLDDAPFAPDEPSRLLLGVRDVGFAAELEVTAVPVRVRATVGPLAVTWRLVRAGRYAVVAGRLDGQAVAAAWPRAADSPAWSPPRRCLPAAAPDRWDVARPWPEAIDSADDDHSPPLALAVASRGDPRATIERVTTWRDGLLHPAANGVARWSVTADAAFVFGDFPAGSRDSRQFGPLPRTALRQRLGP